MSRMTRNIQIFGCFYVGCQDQRRVLGSGAPEPLQHFEEDAPVQKASFHESYDFSEGQRPRQL